MAKIITKSRRRSGGIKKAAKRAARRVVVQTKKIYKSAKGYNVQTKDVVISVAAGGVGAIGSTMILQKLPTEKLPGGAKTANALVAALGGFVAYKGLKKKSMAITGLGMGMAAASAAGFIQSFTATTVNAPFVNPTIAAPIRTLPPQLNAPFVRPSIVRTVKDEEYI